MGTFTRLFENSKVFKEEYVKYYTTRRLCARVKGVNEGHFGRYQVEEPSRLESGRKADDLVL
jgi:hypothetical protein